MFKQKPNENLNTSQHAPSSSSDDSSSDDENPHCSKQLDADSAQIKLHKFVEANNSQKVLDEFGLPLRSSVTSIVQYEVS
jgi:hypothetical protein